MLRVFDQSLLENIKILLNTPFFILVIAVEIFLSNYQHKKLYTVAETATNFFLSIVLVYCWNLAFTSIKNPWLYWVSLVVMIDFVMYWLHRLEHQCRLFWAVH